MKINVWRILSDHFRTLQDGRSGGISVIDLLIFYGAPLALAMFVYFDRYSFEDDIYSQSIAVFAIFSALLFSVQIALFGIYSKSRNSLDEFADLYVQEKIDARRELIRETNSNISYLIVISSFSVTIFLCASVISASDRFEPSFAVFLYIHFMLTLLMVIKRIHALFDKEYRES